MISNDPPRRPRACGAHAFSLSRIELGVRAALPIDIERARHLRRAERALIVVRVAHLHDLLHLKGRRRDRPEHHVLPALVKSPVRSSDPPERCVTPQGRI